MMTGDREDSDSYVFHCKLIGPPLPEPVPKVQISSAGESELR